MLFLSSFILSLVAAAPAASKDKPKPAAFFLAGDSTTAVQSAGGGGSSHPQLPHSQSPIPSHTNLTFRQAGEPASSPPLSAKAPQAQTSATTAQQPCPSAQAVTGPPSSPPPAPQYQTTRPT